MKNLNDNLVVFRCDSSLKIGTGHVMRCITFAKELALIGYEVVFLCRSYEGNLIHLLKESFTVLILENNYLENKNDNLLKGKDIYENWLGCSQAEDAENCIRLIKDNSLGFINLLVIDHYSLNELWENHIKDFLKEENDPSEVTKIFVMDDLAERNHNCDYLVDQTFLRNEKEYRPYVNSNCQLLLGTDYAILRKEFKEVREKSLKRKSDCKNKNVEKILIYLGSFYDLNIINIIFKSISNISSSKNIEVDFISQVGKEKIKFIKQRFIKNFKQLNTFNFVENIADKIYQADLCIGAAGSSSWERCTLGCPTIAIITDENQKAIGENLSIKNVAKVIDLKDNFERNFCEALERLIFDNMKRYNLHKSSFKICDGEGIRRLIEVLKQ